MSHNTKVGRPPLVTRSGAAPVLHKYGGISSFHKVGDSALLTQGGHRYRLHNLGGALIPTKSVSPPWPHGAPPPILTQGGGHTFFTLVSPQATYRYYLPLPNYFGVPSMPPLCHKVGGHALYHTERKPCPAALADRVLCFVPAALFEEAGKGKAAMRAHISG